jgi:hypothetical protein
MYLIRLSFGFVVKYILFMLISPFLFVLLQVMVLRGREMEGNPNFHISLPHFKA